MYPAESEYDEEARQVAALEDSWTAHILCVECDKPKNQHPWGECVEFDAGEPNEDES